MATYPGGKHGAGTYQTIINQIPPHRVYVEPFLGAGAIWRNKLPAAVNIGLDADGAAVRAFAAELNVQKLLAGILRGLKQGSAVAVGCALEFLRSYPFAKDVFIYVDPPYLGSLRSRPGRPYYAHEFMTHAEHGQLLELLLEASAHGAWVAISGYPSEFYEQWLHGWRRLEFDAMTRGGTFRTECLWMNYAEPTELHDYRYVGQGKTDRQMFRRKVRRWANKFRALPPLEQNAILAELRAQ